MRRKLLEDNGIGIVQELSAQIDLAPLHFPMFRASPDTWSTANMLANDEHTSFSVKIKSGLENLDNHDNRFRTVMDYASAY